MLEALIAQVIVIFQKAIKKFARKDVKEPLDVSLLLKLNEQNQLEIYVCHSHIPVREVPAKDVMGMTLWMSGLGGVIVQHIQQIILNFRGEMSVQEIDVCVYLNREDDEDIDFFLYANSEFVRQFYLQEVLKV